MNKSILTTNEMGVIRKFAKEIAKDPYLVELISSLLCDIVKDGKNDFTDSSIDSVDDLDTDYEEDIPIPVVEFLKENVVKRGNRKTGNKKIRLARVCFFIDEIRANILKKINQPEEISCQDLAGYSQIFNMKYVKTNFTHVEKSNEIRLIIAVGLSDYDYNGLLSGMPEYIDTIYDFFKSASKSQVTNMIEAYKFIYF